MHPELYNSVIQEVSVFDNWSAPEIQGRRNYHLGPEQHPTHIQIARDDVWKNLEVCDAIAEKFNLSHDIQLHEPMMWTDDNTNCINDIHVDSPAYYYTYQHCLATSGLLTQAQSFGESNAIIIKQLMKDMILHLETIVVL